MKRKLSIGFLGLLAAGSASAQGLYYVGNEAQESMPVKWMVGADVVYDDNVSPGSLDATGKPAEDSSVAISPYVGMSFVSMTPQTTWDVYARLGLVYYLDAPKSVDEVSSQSRLGVNLTHRVSERLRFSSRNFVSYELEPDYSYGYASSRSVGAYFYWQSDNSIGYRWTERFATYTGLVLSGVTYPDTSNNDRFTWEAYNQFRYQLTPQTVLTADYRYAQTSANGVASDATDQYVLGGVEHRFSPTTIGIVRAGVQFHNVDSRSDSTSPYVEFALNSQLTQQFSVRSFLRYGIENYNTVQGLDTNGDGLSDTLVEYTDTETLRLGVNAQYAISPMFSVFCGVDYIPTSYGSGRSTTMPPYLGPTPDVDEDIINADIGFSVKFNPFLTGTAAYTYTKSSSDIVGKDYDRNRISVGLSAQF